ncbi:MAG: chemotaxis protein CheC [Nanoarchaeota archaeon]
MKKKQLSELEFDSLKEVGNVGVGNAATALSKMLNMKVDINIPETKFIPLRDFSRELGGPENIVVSLYLKMQGELTGECIFVFNQEGAFELIDMIMMQEPGTTTEFGEMEESAFKEMSNIFVGAYLSSLGDMLSLRLMPSVPHAAQDMAQAIIDFILAKLSRSAEDVLCVNTAINIEGHDINGRFLMVFEDESLNKVVDVLHDRFGVE